MIKAPCKNCEERHSGCHCECEKYNLFRKTRTEQNEAMKRQNAIKASVTDIRNNAWKKGART